MSELKGPHLQKTPWQSYIPASVAGVLTLAQLIIVFFLEVDDGNSTLRIFC